MSKTVERTITVPTAPDRVWEYLADFTRSTEWDPPTVRTTRESGDGGVGTRYLNPSRVAGREVEITYTVRTFEPGHELSLVGENPSLETLDTIRLTPEGTGTRVQYTATFSPRGAAKLVEPLLPLGLARLADRTSDRLEECLRNL
ncbi:MAG: SRPBCC family protein [Marmoricola sp.]